MRTGVITNYTMWRVLVKGSKKLIIAFSMNGKFFTQTVYEDYGIEEEKIQRLKQYLDDQIETNRKSELQCSTVTLITMLHEINEILVN